MIATSNSTARSTSEQVRFDEGLRTHMLQVYNYLAAGLGLAAIVAWVVFKLATTSDPALAAVTFRNGIMLSQFGKVLYTSPWMYIVCFAPLVIIIAMAIGQAFLGLVAAQIGYWTFVATTGASLSMILIVFKISAILQILAVTSASFAALSLYGYTTKRDISGWGTFLYMGLAGICLAGIANIFLKSDAMTFARAVAGVFIFAGFTAYDTQQLKDRYIQQAGNASELASAAVWGALNLFLDFVNLFLDLLQIFGAKND